MELTESSTTTVGEQLNETCTSPVVHLLKGVLQLFYIVDPSESSFPDYHVPRPKFTTKAMPYFFAMITMEWIILWGKGRRPPLNDSMMSVVHGAGMAVMQLFAAAILFSSYIHVYTHYAIYRLPWNSVYTWAAAAIGGDLAFYWMHRATHEINVFWATHQVHHSSERFNLSTALRQSIFQAFGKWIFYLPMSLFIPPSHQFVHQELNLVYQFWIHTELIPSLGPLEWILNTPSHHRVHHGCLPYCLDSNYGGVLIIWDRIFGTFVQERKDENIVYGLVDQPQFFKPVKHQVFYFAKVYQKVRSMKSLKEGFLAVVYGPGWMPGDPRLGDNSKVSVEKLQSRLIYNPPVLALLHCYTLPHFILSLLTMSFLATSLQSPTSSVDSTSCMLFVLYLVCTFTALGLFYDRSPWAWVAELFRCFGVTFCLVAIKNGLHSNNILKGIHLGSCFIALVIVIRQMCQLNVKEKKNK